MTAMVSTRERVPDSQHLRLYSLFRLGASGMLFGSQLWPYFRNAPTEPSVSFWLLLIFFLYAIAVSVSFESLQS